MGLLRLWDRRIHDDGVSRPWRGSRRQEWDFDMEKECFSVVLGLLLFGGERCEGYSSGELREMISFAADVSVR